ncbi:hypothetical protein Ndes2526B_g03698 [Nannochloris sp. 'desiccata']|nr:hypothetical protein KSW81_005435 [Chlorella desiccata (nom. nud.)]KAH7621359.1 hypothetical protein NADE_006622 [Chlorella desiccata (nom. nud.)]
MLNSRPLWRLKPAAALGLAAATCTSSSQTAPALLFSLQKQVYYASNAAQAGGQGPLDYYFTAKLALKRILLGQTAAQRSDEQAENAAAALKHQESDKDPIAQKAAEPNATPLPDPESSEGLDWSDEAAYRRTVGPLGDPNYNEMQQAGTAFSGIAATPTGPESTAKENVLKDAMNVNYAPSNAPLDDVSTGSNLKQRKGKEEKEEKEKEGEGVDGEGGGEGTKEDILVKAAL